MVAADRRTEAFLPLGLSVCGHRAVHRPRPVSCRNVVRSCWRSPRSWQESPARLSARARAKGAHLATRESKQVLRQAGCLVSDRQTGGQQARQQQKCHMVNVDSRIGMCCSSSLCRASMCGLPLLATWPWPATLHTKKGPGADCQRDSRLHGSPFLVIVVFVEITDVQMRRWRGRPALSGRQWHTAGRRALLAPRTATRKALRHGP